MIGRRCDVYNGVARGFRGSNIWWRGRSYAASDPSGIPNSSRDHKKVPKDERKAMLESFVNRYRGLNAGKFPTASDARKQVGGSYYVIRKFLQELQHKSRTSPLNKTNEFSVGNEHSRGSQIAVDEGMQKNPQAVDITNVEVGDANAGHMEGKPQASTQTEGTLSEEDLEPTIAMKGKADNTSLPVVEEPVHAAKADAVIDDFAKGEAVSQDYSGEISGEQRAHDEEPPKSYTLWANLKSFADGILNAWRKH